MSNYTISTIIPAYNSSATIIKALESVLAQSHCVDEIIVIDDGSRDNTGETVLNFIKQTRFAGKPVIKYIHQQNAGPAAARNTGIRNSTCELIAFLDSDDTWLPDKIKKQLELFCSDEKINFICTDRLRIDKNHDKTICYKSNDKAIVKYSYEDLWKQQNPVITSSVMLKKTCIEHSGYFDERTEVLGCEDLDLWLRIAENTHLYLLNIPLVNYTVSNSGYCRSNIDRAYKSLEYVIKKYSDRLKQYTPNYEKILKTKWFNIYFNYGNTLFYLNRIKDAHSKYKTALQYNKRNPSLWLWFLISSLNESLLISLKEIRRGRRCFP